jgi:hypothetical protein
MGIDPLPLAVGTLDAFVPPLFRLPHVVIEPSAFAPAGSGYTKIYSNTYAFAALAHDGSIKSSKGMFI